MVTMTTIRNHWKVRTRVSGTTHSLAMAELRSVLQFFFVKAARQQLTSNQADSIFSGISTFGRLKYHPCLSSDVKYDIAFIGMKTASRRASQPDIVARCSLRHWNIISPRCPLRAQWHQTRFSPPQSLVRFLKQSQAYFWLLKAHASWVLVVDTMSRSRRTRSTPGQRSSIVEISLLPRKKSSGPRVEKNVLLMFLDMTMPTPFSKSKKAITYS